MPIEPPRPAALPEGWHTHQYTFTEAVEIVGAPTDTVYGWTKFIRAMDYQMGDKKDGRRWLNPHEIYTLCLIQSVYSLGIPIGLKQLKAVLEFVDEDAAPTGSLIIKANSKTAVIFIYAPEVFAAVGRIHARATKALEAHDAEGIDVFARK